MAVGFILVAILYLYFAFLQPSDGWLYETRLDGQLIAVGSLLDGSGPLQPGDQVLAIENIPVDAVHIQPITPPPGWYSGGSAQYTILRDGVQQTLSVPLSSRSLKVISRFYSLNNSFLLINLLWYLIGFGVFILRPRETAAGLLLLITTYWNTIDTFISIDTSAAFYYYPSGLFWANILLNNLWLFMFAMIIHFVLVFPVRKWPLSGNPRLTIALLYGLPAVGTLAALSLNQIAIYNLALAIMVLATVLSLILTSLDNYRRLRSPVIRAQLGWVVLGISAPVIGGLIGFAGQSLFPELNNNFANGVWGLFSVMLPLCFGIAITRYRLFDISIIIRRTLVYSLLTISLALVYFGLVVILQNIFGMIAGASQSNLVIILSTLVIAALFNPLRHRFQEFIDRRFYRRKYDAEQTLQAFSAVARDDVSLDHLSGQLLKVVEETIQPESLSLWLKK